MVNCDTFKIVIVLNSYFQTNLQINCTKDFLLQWEFYMRVLLVEDDVRIANFVSKDLRENRMPLMLQMIVNRDFIKLQSTIII